MDLPSQIYAYRTTGGFFKSYMNPGMETAQAYSMDIYSAVHFGFKNIRIKKSIGAQAFVQQLLIRGFDVLTQWLPLGVPWLHEEYHRGMMSQYGINSFNEVLTFPFGKSSIAVNRVKDEELEMLCDRHHSDFVRLISAGHEGEVQLIRNLQSNEFFITKILTMRYFISCTPFKTSSISTVVHVGGGDEGTSVLPQSLYRPVS